MALKEKKQKIEKHSGYVNLLHKGLTCFGFKYSEYNSWIPLLSKKVRGRDILWAPSPNPCWKAILVWIPRQTPPQQHDSEWLRERKCRTVKPFSLKHVKNNYTEPFRDHFVWKYFVCLTVLTIKLQKLTIFETSEELKWVMKVTNCWQKDSILERGFNMWCTFDIGES